VYRNGDYRSAARGNIEMKVGVVKKESIGY